MPVNITQIITGDYRVNTYLISCTETGKGVIIDPGGEEEKILQAISKNKLTIEYILNTHGHADHVVANKALKQSLEVPICIHEDDFLFFSRPEIKEVSEKELGISASGKADIPLRDNTTLTVGNLSIQTIHTPGHTPGSTCYLIEGNLFTGDTLFVGDVGRTDLTGGSFKTLLQSIKDKIITLPPETVIHPGHDYGETPTSTLSWEMLENPYITDFILAEDQ